MHGNTRNSIAAKTTTSSTTKKPNGAMDSQQRRGKKASSTQGMRKKTRNVAVAAAVLPAPRNNDDDGSSMSSGSDASSVGIATNPKKRQLELVVEENGELVDQLDKLNNKFQRMEDLIKKITPPPLLSVFATTKQNVPGEPISAVTSKTGLFSEEMVRSMLIFRKHLLSKLKAYVKTTVYCFMKFGNTRKGNQTRNMSIVQTAIDSGNMEIPENVDAEQQVNYFKDKIPTILNQLRHNSQTLARRNWIGEV